MEELKDVILNVYTLPTDSPELGSSGSFLGRLLPSIGMGAYHTSLQLDGYEYTFAANRGIVKSPSRHEGVPRGATFKESIALGSNSKSRGEINAIVKKLEQFFTPTAYHLVHRNCNHFSETFATALIMESELIENKSKRLKKYPVWVNRLATTGSSVIPHDDDIVPCNIFGEARNAVGADEKTSWNLTSSSNDAKSIKTVGKKGKKECKFLKDS